jgi:cytochrome c oxidase assembly factor CtaG
MSLTVHMLVHCALVAVLAPILVLGFPGKVTPRSPATRALTAPAVAWLLFVGTQVAFHLSGLYRQSIDPVADTAIHAVYMGTALLFWEVAIGSALPRRLRGLGPALYLLFAMPAIDLSAAWLMTEGESGAGVAMIAGMAPLGLAAALCAWRAAKEEEIRAGVGGAA